MTGAERRCGDDSSTGVPYRGLGVRGPAGVLFPQSREPSHLGTDTKRGRAADERCVGDLHAPGLVF